MKKPPESVVPSPRFQPEIRNTCSRLVLPPRLERPGTRSEGPDGRFGAKLFFKFFTTRVGWRIFTTDLSHGKNENFFALLKRFRRTTFC